MRCHLCRREKSHVTKIDNLHQCCICYLLSYNSTCCAIGFKNVLYFNPDLIKFIKMPPKFTNRTRMMHIVTSNLWFDDQDVRVDCQKIFTKAKAQDSQSVDNLG